MNSNVQNNSIISTSYEDLGQVITATNMAAGAVVYSNWYDNVQWVRNQILLHQSDQQYDVSVVVRDSTISSGAAGTSSSWTNLTANSSWWRPNVLSPNSNGAVGFSVRYSIKNSSAVSNTFASLKVQLRGL